MDAILSKAIRIARDEILPDTNMLTALGYATPPSLLKVLVDGAMKIRALALQKITFKRYPSFVTTEKNRTYPKEYEIRQLGPPKPGKRILKQKFATVSQSVGLS